MHALYGDGDDVDARLAAGMPTPACLYVRTPAGELEKIPLERSVLLIGGSRLADIARNDDNMAPQHAKLVTQGKKHWLHDLGSGKGTYLNGERISEAQLRDRDTIQLGNTHFTYRAAFQPGERITHAAGESGALPALRPDVMLRQLALQQLAAQAQGAPGGGGDEERVDLQQIVAKVRRVLAFFRYYWWVIVLCTVLGTGAGLALGLKGVAPARAEFRIRLTPDAIDNPMEMQQRIKYFDAPQEEFRNPDLIRATLDSLLGREVGLGELDHVRGQLEFRREGQTLWFGSYSTIEGPDAALEFLDAHLDNYVESEIEKTLAVLIRQEGTMRSQIDDTRRELKRIEQERERFKRENLGRLPEQGNHYARLDSLRGQRLSLSSSLESARADLALAQGKLNDDDSLLVERRDTIRPLQARKTTLNQELAELEAGGAGQEHPDVVALKAKIKQLDEQIERELNRDASPLEKRLNPEFREARRAVQESSTNVRVLEKQLAAVDQEIGRLSGVVKDLPELEAKAADIERDFASTQSHYNRALEKFRNTQVQLRLERDVAKSRYHVVTKPHVLPQSRAKGIVLRALLGLLVGFALGVAIGVFRQVGHYIVLRA